MTAPRGPAAAAVVVGALLLQLTVLSRMPLPGATPDLVLVVVVVLAVLGGPAEGAVVGFLTGLALDLVPPADGTIGRWALVLTVVGYAAGHARSDVERSPLLPLGVVAVAATGALMLHTGLGMLLGDPRVTWSLAFRLLPTAVLYDVALAPLVVPAVTSLARPDKRAAQLR